jgi:TolB-like protein
MRRCSRPTSRAGRLAEGLERWAGDFLRGAEDVGGGEDYTAWLERERESLRRTAVVGFTRIVDQERAANNSPDLLRWTRRWAERFPNDETAHLRLIDALQRNNDLNEARNIYADFVARLKAELDVTPSIELIRLGEQLSKATQKERDRRPGSGAIVAPELVGRGAAVVASLVELWSRARAEGSAVVIEGERGTGKTRLCAELAQRVRGDGAPALVLDVRADDSDLSTTWSTLRRIMAGLVRSSAIEDAPNKALVELADMLPDLRARFPHLGASSGSADRAESALSDVLRVVGAHAPVLMIVDDAEFADADSHRLIKRLMASVLPGTMIVLALDPARDGGMERASELAEIPGVRRFKLAMLTEEETGALVDSMLEIAPADRAALVGRVYRDSGGSPQRATAIVSEMTGNGALTLDQRGLWGMGDRGWGKGELGEGGKGTGDGGFATTLVAASPTPHAPSPFPRRLLIAGAAILLLVAAIPLVRARASSSKTVDDPSVAPRVAVLDLELTGADTADAYLASGLAEEINSTLSRFEELRIKSRGSVRTARRAGLIDAVKLGEALQVDYLVEGSVRHVGDSFKIAVRLTKTSDGFQVWSKDFDASASALPAMHERIASEVASRIGGRLTRVELASTRRLPTSDAQAYEHYLRGNYFLGRRTPPFVEQAIAQYRLAVAAIPRSPPHMLASATRMRCCSIGDGRTRENRQSSYFTRASSS